MTEQRLDLSGLRVWVAGHNGMVGSAVVRRLASEDCDILKVDRAALDLTCQADVHDWMNEQRPDVVVMAAAKVGGIWANDHLPAEFIYSNLAIETNIVHSAWLTKVRKLLFLGSSCIYPKFAPQPMTEDALLTGELEPTNEWYAIAKIAGIKLCQAYRKQYGCDFISVMPTNLYGPNDNFDLQSSHVLPALLVKAHQAKLAGEANMQVWGSGKAKREFLYVDDLADAVVHLLGVYSDPQHVNIGTGVDLSIRELAETIQRIVGFQGKLVFDPDKPDGTPRKLLDVSRLARLGWTATTTLEDGIAKTYRWYLDNAA